MKQLKFIALLFILPMLVACPAIDYKHFIRFDNNSDTDVYIYMGLWGRGNSLYPDTTIGAEVKCGVLFKKGETRYYSYNYDYNQEHTNVLCLFIFDANVFDTCSWGEIKKDYKILRRYDLSLQDIERLDRKISYPPTETMKNIKMYPPYE